MIHPHGLTRQDVAHLKAGDEVTVRINLGVAVYEAVTKIYTVGDSWLWATGQVVRTGRGEPGDRLVEVISPKPPMAEPTWLGAVVMDGDGLVAVRTDDDPICWFSGGAFFRWHELVNPRPLTDAERRDLGIPATLPEGWVAVDARDIGEESLRIISGWDVSRSEDAPSDILAQRVARAELARREATE